MERAILDALTGDGLTSGTHAHIIGSSGSGKSRFLESLIRTALYDQSGFCLIDWHGPVYEGIVNYLGFHQVNHCPIYILDPANGEFITPYNPFRGEARNPVEAANSFLDALVKTWGSQDTNATPRIEQIARLLFLICVVSGESLANVSTMLRADRGDVRRWAWKLLDSPSLAFMRDELQDLAEIDPKKWNEHVSSTIRRIGRLLSDPAISRFFALTENTLDIPKLMDDGAVILVNLADRNYLDRQSAKAFASVLLSNFFRAAMRRSDRDDPRPFFLFMDEFHEYLTPDSPKMLEGVRKGGLHLVMAHQHLEQLDQDGTKIRASILQNARVQVCFAQQDVQSAKFMAEQMFLHELNQTLLKDEVKRWETTSHVLQKEPTFSRTRSIGTTGTFSQTLFNGEESARATSGESELVGVASTEGTALFLRPILEHNTSSRTFFSPEEKLNLLAEKLTTLGKRECFVRFDSDIPLHYQVPDVERYIYDEWDRDEYLVEIFNRTGAVTIAEADELIARSRDAFLQKVRPPKKDKKPKSPPADPSPSAPTQKPF